MKDKPDAYVTFKDGNNVIYGQDMGFHRGVPAGVRFAVYKQPFGIGKYKLVADGYGSFKHGERYGNGAIYVPWGEKQ